MNENNILLAQLEILKGYTPGGGGGAPSGPASNDLGGSYPGPTVVNIGNVPNYNGIATSADISLTPNIVTTLQITANKFTGDGSGLTNLASGSGALLAANNLDDLDDLSLAQGNLGLNSAAIDPTISSSSGALNVNLGSGGSVATDTLSAPLVKADTIADSSNTNNLATYSSSQWHLSSNVDMSAAVNTAATDPNITSDAQTGLLKVTSSDSDPNVSCATFQVPDNTKRAQVTVRNTGDGENSQFCAFEVNGSGYSGGSYVGHGAGSTQFVAQGSSMQYLDFGAYNDVPFTLFTNDTAKIVMSTAGGIAMQDVLQLASFTVGTLPSASTFVTGIIIVSDATGGPALCFSDGTNWISVKTGVPVA